MVRRRKFACCDDCSLNDGDPTECDTCRRGSHWHQLDDDVAVVADEISLDELRTLIRGQG